MKPFIKWAGGKKRELPIIHQYLPEFINNYVEPFLGGGSVYLDLIENDIHGVSYLNDFSTELINLYNSIMEEDVVFFETLECLDADFISLENISENCKQQFNGFVLDCVSNLHICRETLLEICDIVNAEIHLNIENENETFLNIATKCIENKIKRIISLSQRNQLVFIDTNTILETSLKSAYYIYIRDLYNSEPESPLKDALFFFVREYCYSSMFRYNDDGDFNVPYGGSGYNKKHLTNKIEYMRSEQLVNTLLQSHIENLDFEEFINGLNLDNDDFVFVDPPYDTEFNEYVKNTFDRDDQTRLAHLLSHLNCNVMLIIKETDFIYNLYNSLGFNIIRFEKRYNVNFMNRNAQRVTHLIITNY